MIEKIGRQLLSVFLLLQILLVLGYDNRSIFSSAMIVNAASTQPTCAVVGVGVLGASLCKQLLEDPDCKNIKGVYAHYLYPGGYHYEIRRYGCDGRVHVRRLHTHKWFHSINHKFL